MQNSERLLIQVSQPVLCVLQHAMAVLAFKADTQCSAYKDLFAESQWKLLEELFYQELYRLNNLTSQSLLAIHLQVTHIWLTGKMRDHHKRLPEMWCRHTIACCL